MKKRNVLYGLTIVWLVFIFWNSFQSAAESSGISSPIVDFVYNSLLKINIKFNYKTLSIIIRKSAHVFEYMILGILMILNFFETKLSDKYCLLYAFFVSMLIAITDEIIQTYVGGRAGMVLDVGFDTLGISLGIILVCLVQLWINKKRRNNNGN